MIFGFYYVDFFMNVVLIGYRGAGKTIIGSRLAARTGKKFADTDDLTEKREGSSIDTIVRNHGWRYFRILEKEIIEEVAREDGCIIATGGGAVLDPENVKAFKKNSLIIWLQADPQVLCRRIEEDPRNDIHRPPLTGKGTLEELEETIIGRTPFYRKAADIELDTSNLDTEAVVEKIISIIRERGRD